VFEVSGRAAALTDFPVDACAIPPGPLEGEVRGYLVGDRLVADDARVDPDPSGIARESETVWLLEDGLDMFVRVEAGRPCEGGPLVFAGVEMPLGPESEVLRAYEDRLESVGAVKGVTPALEAAFRMECWRRSETERRRAEVEAARARQEARDREEQRLAELTGTLGTGKSRREMAALDFAAAATAALAVGGAEYLSHRPSSERNEMVVRFRLLGRRFECTCDPRTLQIVEAGICLTAHEDDPDFEGGTKGDGLLTLESLPRVIAEAESLGVLVVFRHLND
jgi:hypothetical protein